jgi:Polyketide cyclase / dehydrase and lipid transport
MTAEQATLPIAASPKDIRRILLDPLGLPSWNEAFTSVDGPREPSPGVQYAIRTRPGLKGTLEYATITATQIEMVWQVPGFREVNSWTLHPDGAGTSVGHAFRHSGPLAAALSRAYRGVAALRLQRLAQQVTS